MDFQDFLQYIPLIVPAQLPGEKAHAKMAPLQRLIELNKLNVDESKTRKAAVMMLLYPKKGQTHIILIVRNTYKGVHSAQIAFPGGRHEEFDTNFEQTALRETQEEIGVATEKIKIIKEFTPMYIPPSNFMVYPFLGIANEELLFFPNSREVAEIVEIPLAVFMDDKIIVETTLTTSYAEKANIPVFKVESHVIWGATAMILSELREVFKAVLGKQSK